MCWDYSDCGSCGHRTYCVTQCYCSEYDIDNGCCEHRDCKSFDCCDECGSDLCENCDSKCEECNRKHCEKCTESFHAKNTIISQCEECNYRHCEQCADSFHRMILERKI